MDTCSIPVYSFNEFANELRRDPEVLAKHPCLIQDFVTRWKAFREWNSYSSLDHLFGTRKVRAGAPQFMTNTDQKLCEVETTYHKYLQYVQDPGSAGKLFAGEWIHGGAADFAAQRLPLYSGNITFVRSARDGIFEKLTPLAPGGLDVWNAYIPYYYALRNHVWLFVSPAGALTPLHEDAQGVIAYLAQIQGVKAATLFPPSERHCYYNPTCGYVDPSKPDRSKFPEFDRAQCWKGMLSAGETLLFGSNWAHHVVTLSASITVGLDIINAQNIDAYAGALDWPQRLWAVAKGVPAARAELEARGLPRPIRATDDVGPGRDLMRRVLRAQLRNAPGAAERAAVDAFLGALGRLAPGPAGDEPHVPAPEAGMGPRSASRSSSSQVGARAG